VLEGVVEEEEVAEEEEELLEELRGQDLKHNKIII